MTSGRRILAMGGMGFVGTTIVQQLAKMKHVEVIDRLDCRTSPEVEPLLRGKKIEFIEVDVPYLFPLQSRLARGEFDDVAWPSRAWFEIRPAEAGQVETVMVRRETRCGSTAGCRIWWRTPECVPEPHTDKAVGANRWHRGYRRSGRRANFRPGEIRG